MSKHDYFILFCDQFIISYKIKTNIWQYKNEIRLQKLAK